MSLKDSPAVRQDLLVLLYLLVNRPPSKTVIEFNGHDGKTRVWDLATFNILGVGMTPKKKKNENMVRPVRSTDMTHHKLNGSAILTSPI